MDYEQMKRALLGYNWDDGFEFPKTQLYSSRARFICS